MTNKDLGIREVNQNCIVNEYDVLIVGNSSGNITVKLVAANGTSQVFYFKNIGTGTMTITPDCLDTIDGDTTVALTRWDSLCTVDYAKTKWLKP